MKKILFAILPIALSVSCSKVSNFDTPDTAALAAEQAAKAKTFNGATISYDALRAKVSTSFATYEENDAFEGYVISSDEGGNFYKKVYVQAADKSGTIAVSIDKKGLYAEYPVGSKVQVRLKGTTVWYASRYSLLEVGYGHGKTTGGNLKIGHLTPAMYPEVLLLTGEKAPISELATTLTNLQFNKRAQANKLLVLDGVYFKNQDVGKTFHTSDNQYNTTYTLTDNAGGTLPFLTSSYAAYIKDHVPAGRLRITGVLTMYGNNPQFFINDIKGIEKSEE